MIPGISSGDGGASQFFWAGFWNGKFSSKALPGVEPGNARSNRVGFCCLKSKDWESDRGQAQDSLTAGQ